MLILSIETSCDETAVAIVRSGGQVCANAILSSAQLHIATGGIVPEVAAREHVHAMLPVLRSALDTAGVTLAQIEAIAVTTGPGLMSSLLTGVATANALATLLAKPLIPVNHVYGHICSNWLERAAGDFAYPILTLTVSGGHNELVLLQSQTELTVLGETRDDAAGEAFDKVARLLDLPYPGGPAIEQLATQHQGDHTDPLPRAWLLPKDLSRNHSTTDLGDKLRSGKVVLTSWDFSFSGLKSEVRRRVELGADRVELAANFQTAVVDVLATKLLLAAKKYGARELHLAGGVSANQALRARATEYAEQLGIPLRYPARLEYCTDNAAMIAAAGYALYLDQPERFCVPPTLLDADPGLELARSQKNDEL